jgi:hypothetical protein
LAVSSIVDGHHDGRPQSPVQGIQRLYTVGVSYKTLAIEPNFSSTTLAEAMYSTDSESPLIHGGPKKVIPPEISSYIETSSLMLEWRRFFRVSALTYSRTESID